MFSWSSNVASIYLFLSLRRRVIHMGLECFTDPRQNTSAKSFLCPDSLHLLVGHAPGRRFVPKSTASFKHWPYRLHRTLNAWKHRDNAVGSMWSNEEWSVPLLSKSFVRIMVFTGLYAAYEDVLCQPWYAYSVRFIQPHFDPPSCIDIFLPKLTCELKWFAGRSSANFDDERME